MSEPPKVLCLAVDSAERDLILRWCEEGLLPTFHALRNKAAWCAVASTHGFGNNAMWPTFYTGLSPARHGRYAPTQLRDGSYDLEKVGVDAVKGEPFWQALSRAGRRVAVINVPKAPLTADLNGVQLADWGTHDYDHGGVCSWPPAFADTVIDRFGADTLGKCDLIQRDSRHYGALRDGLVARVHRSADLAEHLLREDDWDLFLMTFGDSHCVGHQCWHIHDPKHPEHLPGLAAAVGDPVLDVYQAIDAALGRLLKHAGPETHVVVFVGPGMEPTFTGNHLMDPVLQALDAAAGPDNRGVESRLRALWGRMPPSLQEELKHAVRKVSQPRKARGRVRRRWFYLNNHLHAGAIRINLAGREPNGRIQPGAEYDAVCEALTQDLLDLRKPDTGTPAIEEVIRTRDHYRGENLDRLPDLLALWNRDGPVTAVESAKVGLIRRPMWYTRSGDHTEHCLCFSLGPGVQAGRLQRPAHVTDMAPTLAALLGVTLADTDGQPVADLLGTRGQD